jgi:sec-independent protein translocase protein TatB
MFEIGWTELLVIAVVAIIVIGPKELPRLMRTFGHYTGKLRRAAADFQRQFEEAARETELDEVRRAMHDFRSHASVDLSERPAGRPLMTRQTRSPEPSAAPPSKAQAKPAEVRKSRQASAAKKPSSRANKTQAPKPPRGRRRSEETP